MRTTEYAALACARWIGRGDKEGADGAAVDAMRLLLDTVSMDGTVVIGEGEKDEAPMLYNGERTTARRPRWTSPWTRSRAPTCVPRACRTRSPRSPWPSAARCSIRGPCVYMLKMATSRDMAHLLDLDRPIGETLQLMAKEKGVQVGDLVVIMLDRPRHDEYMTEIRGVGARIRLIPHGDVSAALAAVTEGSAVDLLYGIGGTPEGVLPLLRSNAPGARSSAACGRAPTRSGAPRSRPTTTSRRCSTATGSSQATTCSSRRRRDRRRDARGRALQRPQGATTESISMRSRSGTVRTITARHDRAKLREITGERLG